MGNGRIVSSLLISEGARIQVSHSLEELLYPYCDGIAPKLYVLSKKSQTIYQHSKEKTERHWRKWYVMNPTLILTLSCGYSYVPIFMRR